MRARSPDEFARIGRLLLDGLSTYEVSRRTGIPRGTVQNWKNRTSPPGGAQTDYRHWRPPDPASYSYLLGLYLGDGHIYETSPRAVRLGLYLDARYPGIIESAATAIRANAPETPVCRNRKPGAIVLLASHPVWLSAFPQHGPGRKHKRRIALTDWQREITTRHPRALVRGLIHSDGCRTVNRFSTPLPSGRIGHYAYARYFFSNLSADIRAIFSEHCDLLRIRWTQSNPRNISIAHRDSVAKLDEFIGPKR